MPFQLDKDTLEQMIEYMDIDGDGCVTMAEFKVPYMKLHPKVTEEQFQAVWKEIDHDGNGQLSVVELGEHYGYHLSPNAHRKNQSMDDSQILEALKMHDQLQEMNRATEARRASLSKVDPKPSQRRLSLTGELKDLGLGPSVTSSGHKGVVMPKKVRTDETMDEFQLFLQHCDAGDGPYILDYINKGGELRIEDEAKGETSMHKIAKYDLVPHIRLILGKSQKGDVNIKDRQGKTPLFNAAEAGNIEMVKTLMDRGADYFCEDNNGFTALHYAVNSNSVEVVKCILNHEFVNGTTQKEMINKPDRTGRSPLHIAAFKSNEEITRLLVSCGADCDVVDSAGNKPVTIAKKAGRKNSRELLELKTSDIEAAVKGG